MKYYKHLYNKHPSQENNFILKLIQRKIPNDSQLEKIENCLT